MKNKYKTLYTKNIIVTLGHENVLTNTLETNRNWNLIKYLIKKQFWKNFVGGGYDTYYFSKDYKLFMGIDILYSIL